MEDLALNSRNIPYPIKREVRQRCGFGCVICGFPLYEYDHLDDWAKVKKHEGKNITLLCDKHHKEKTNGLLPIKDVENANADPFNKRNGVTPPYTLYYSGNEIEVNLGSNWFKVKDSGKGVYLYPIIIDSTPLFEIKLLNGQIFLDILIFDKYNHLVFQIKENQLLYSTKPWDIELIGKKLTIREGKGKILIEFDFHPPNKILINRGKFLLNGVEILIKPDGITLTNIMFTIGNISHKSQGGLAVGGSKLPFKCFSHVKQVPRYVDDINKLLKKN